MLKRLPISVLLLLLGVTSLQAQVADFTANKVTGCDFLIVNFTDLSTGGTGTPSWFWEFGNSNTSTDQNPSATYGAPGTYTIKLTYKNGSGTNTKTKTSYITVFSSPIAKFSASDTAGCFPLTVTFTDISNPGTGAVQSRLWTFGDGSPASNATSPIHTYAAAGNYTVSLTITDINGCVNTITKAQHIKVSTSALTASFTSSPSIGCKAPATFSFTNTSTGTGLNYSWTFGDSQTSTSTSPTNTYSTSGTYTVSLTANSSNGCAKTATSTVSILGASTITFSASDSSVCEGSTVTFTDLTLPAPTSWKWDFGDGSASTSQNPTHLYNTAGTYAVKLTAVFSGLCTDSITKAAFITVNPKPTVAFTADTTHTCSAPFTVKFTDQTVGSAKWTWDFGDGSTSNLQNPTHVYNTDGLYSVKLVVTTAFGCIDSLTKLDYIKIIKPVANFSVNPNQGCVPLTVNFTNTSSSTEPIVSYVWDFGDPASGANNTSALPNPTHIYNAIGNYNVRLTITNSYGCTSTLLLTPAVQVTDKPTVNFTVTPLQSCALTPVIFDGSSSVNGTTWIWSFGDGQTGSGPIASHNYLDTGMFDIRLIVLNIGCPDTLIKTQHVHISPAVPRFTSALNCSNVLSSTFTNSSLGATKWYWDFGDGSNIDSTTFSPTHTYATAGTYKVKLTAYNISSGCRKDTSLNITLIDLKPSFSLSPKEGCNPLPVSFLSTTTGGTVSNYRWVFGDGSSVQSSNPSLIDTNRTYTTTGKFTVKLFVTDNYGCVDSLIKTDSVFVYDITPNFYVKSKVGCDSLLVQFRDTSITNPAATAWAWSFGDPASGTANTSSAQHPSHYYKTTGVYNVSLTVTNADGSCSVTKSNIVNFTLPKANFTPSVSTTCPGSNVNFANSSTNSNKYSWNFGDPTSGINNSSLLTTPSHIYAANGSYTIKLVITDSITGCMDSITKNNAVIIDKPIAGFTTSTTASTCPPLPVTFVDTSLSVSAITSRYWDFGDLNIAPLVTNDTAANTYTAAGKYTVKLIVTNTAGCKDTITKTDLVIVNGPSGNYTFAPLSGCVPLIVNFSLTTINTKTDSLDFGDGKFFVGDTCCVTHQYDSPGTYLPFLTLIDTAGCSWLVPSNTTITADGFPNPDFSFSPQFPKAGEVVQFTDMSATGATWLWSFGDGVGTSTSKNPTYAYAKSGEYYVKLIVDNNGCIDSITKKIVIVEDLIIPNVFSPNNDGVNDVFTLDAYGIAEIEIFIFDRWGLEMFHKIAQKIFWDGRTNAGLEVTTGTYYYIVEATVLGSTEKMKLKGFLQIQR